MSSPALQYTLQHLNAAVENIRGEISAQEESLGSSELDESDASAAVAISKGESMTCNQKVYRVGEFVYVDSEEKGNFIKLKITILYSLLNFKYYVKYK